PLTAPAPLPHAGSDVGGQVVMQPTLSLGEDFGFAGADLLLQLAESRLARALARIDAALRHLPRRKPRRHGDAAAHASQRRPAGMWSRRPTKASPAGLTSMIPTAGR